jgi:hypothetical protein
MQTSEQTNELAQALAKAQGQMKNAKLDSSNPHFRSKYASLSEIRDTVTKPLADNGISCTQMTGVDENGQFVLCTRLTHSSGQYMESRFPLPVNLDKMQAMGSALSYARRYTLAAVCGIAAGEDDDDAESAPDNRPPQRQQQPAKTYTASAKRGDKQPAKQPEPEPEPEPTANAADYASPNVAAGEHPDDSALVREVFRLCVDSAPDTGTLKAWWDEHQHAYEVLTDEDKKRVNAMFKKRKQALTQAKKEAA